MCKQCMMVCVEVRGDCVVKGNGRSVIRLHRVLVLWASWILLFPLEAVHQTANPHAINPSLSALQAFGIVGKIEVLHSHLDCNCS